MNFERFKPIYFRIIRKNAGFSLENMAMFLNLSKSELSRLERAEKPFPNSVFNKGTICMNPDYCFIKNDNYPVEDYLIDLVRSDYYGREDLVEEKLCWFRQNSDPLLNSQWIFHYKLFLLYCAAYQHIDSVSEEEIKTLETAHTVFGSDFQCLFYLCKSRWLGINGKETEAKSDFSIAKSCNIDSRIPEMDEMLLLLEIQLRLLTGSLVDSFALIYQLKEAYYRQKNFWKLTPLVNLESCLYMQANDYKSAKKILIDEYQNKSIDTKTIKLVIDNIIWCDLYLGDYKAALMMMDELLIKCGGQPQGNYFYKPLCLYKTNRKDEAVMEIDRLKKLANDQDIQYINLQNAYIAKRTKTFLRLADNFINRLIKNRKFEEAKFLLNCEIDYLDDIDDPKTANERRKTLVQLLENRL